MTDTGQVPGKGLPENAGMVEQPGVPAPGTYTYLDHSGSVPEAVTEDDDLLLMPGAQGAWSDPQTAAPPAASEPAPTAAQEAGHVQPVPVAQDTTAARYAPVPGTQPVPGYADAGAAAAPAPGQPHAPVAQEQQYLGHEQQFPAPEQQFPTPEQQFPAPEQHAAYVQGVPQQALHAQAVAPQATAEQSVAGQAVDPGQYAVPAEPAPHGQSPLHAQPAVPVQSADQGQPVDQGQSAPEQHGAAEQPAHETGAHEAGGRDSGSLDLGGVRMPPPAVAAQTPARRPLHMGPPVPEANSGVVRSLADRGPAAHRAGGSAAPRQSAVAAPVSGPPTGGLEYLDVPRDEGDLLPGPQLGEIPPQATSPWAAQQAQPHVAVAAPEETAPETTAAETVPPQAVQGSAAEAAVHAPQAAPTEPYPAAVAAEAPQDPMATGQFVPVEGSLPTGPSLAPSPVAVTAPAPASTEQEQEAVTETADATALPAAEPAVGQQPEPEVADVPPVAVAEPVPAPEAETAEPTTVPEQTAAAVPGEAPAPGPLAEPEPRAEAEAVATVPAPREAGATDGTAAPGQDGPAADALDGTQPAAPPAPVTEEGPVAEPEPVDSVAATAGRTPGAEAAADAETPVAPADADHGTAGSVPAPAAEPAPESEPGAEPRPAAEAQPDVQAEPAGTEPDREAGAEPADEGPQGAAQDIEADAGEIHGTPAPGYADAEREAVLRVMRERRDIRNGFRSDPIPHDVLLRVLEAAHTAPSVGHSQPWDFVVIRSAETRRSMHELAQRQREAYAKSLPKGRAKQFKELKIEAILDTPVNIVVTADPTRGGRHTLGRHTQPQMAPYSSALAVENLWLAARAEGLGVGWVSFFDEREMVRALGLPEHLEVVAYLCVGYVDEFPEEPELMQAGWSKRRPLSWVVHEETYGRRALPGEEPHDLLQETVSNIRPLDAKALGEAWERQKRMTKPAGALGMLEIISAQLAGLSRMCPPPIPEPAAVAIFAGDHGVHAQGVTAWPQEVTGQMVANFLGGGAVCNAFANQVGAEVCVIDVGVASDLPATPGLLPRKVRPGTADFTTGPALSREEVLAAIEVGIESARDLVSAGNKALLTGEMGIANTTASAALISVYTGVDPAEVTGRGTGINDEMHARKVDVVRRALELHQPDAADPVGVLAAVGGLEHAALVGFILGGASLRTPVVLDGVSAGAAALVARAVAPEALAACIAGHRSAEPGHVAALNKLGLRPLVDLDLRLGEGTGALLALPLVQSAARAMHEVATFDSAGVTEK
ncbi:nicotinate-nucleotide--dimethylbenzimidazole phosphoribosyltransferase [Streptomyces sp. NPDC007988]|uniref:nicotinate-nucleotide--dimethylbenzimidazole phosphoribosyltransferase n=1 Tax=Streptomyces sp. NPDC007988 TaxID=3364802 RepID=UPI0036E040B6